MADDVITTFKDDQDALKFKDLLNDFEKASGLTLNASKSKAYCTNVSSNTTLISWGVPMVDIHSETFLYLGVPMNGLDWKEKIANLLKKKHVKTLVRETNRKIQPSKMFKVTEEEVMTPIWLGGFGLINLSKQLLGRRASQGLNLPTGKITIVESPLGKMGFSQEKSEVHSSFAQSVTLDLNSLKAPDQELIKWIQLAGEATPTTALSFSSSSKRYYQAHKKEKLIVPTRTKDDDKTKWRTFWAFFAKQAAKFPGAFHYFHLLQTGHIQHRLGLNSTSKCKF
ncbi:unnamed protein product [Ambrosiozyma monospora]|uniref:Unnamed protein product n=1 Tax=Ambrosiozyma monospora TaxID=43982 RepID=A0ACB5STG2_AMBMO|nr:unnamed protein product [Ambrosiozyma monospora]